MSPGKGERYCAADNSILTDEQAERVGIELEQLGDDVSPKELVDWAKRNKKSESYKHFDWNDASAAASFRLVQARKLIRSIEITRTDSGESETYRAFHSVIVTKSDDAVQLRYVSMDKIAQSANLEDQLVGRAHDELQSWKRRYESYEKHFKSVFAAIDKAKKPARKGRKKAG